MINKYFNTLLLLILIIQNCKMITNDGTNNKKRFYSIFEIKKEKYESLEIFPKDELIFSTCRYQNQPPQLYKLNLTDISITSINTSEMEYDGIDLYGFLLNLSNDRKNIYISSCYYFR